MVYVVIILLFAYFISILSIYYTKQEYNFGLYLCFIRAGFLLPYYQLGIVCKKYNFILTKYRSAYLISLLEIGLVSILIFPNLNALVIGGNFSGSAIGITILTTVCILIVATIAEILVPAFENNKIVKVIGNNTVTIMMHHGFVIFMINFVVFMLSKKVEMASFNVEVFQWNLWYAYPWKDERIFIVYVLLGVSVPIIVKILYEKLVLWLIDKIC